MGDRLPQMVECALRFGNRRGAGASASPYCDDVERRLSASELREPSHYSPEGSRRARSVELWAAIRSLGRSGLREMIERNCRAAQVFAGNLRKAGFTILNDVVLNQVLVSFGTPEETRRIIAEIQSDGTCWCGGTQWQGHTAMRIS